MHHNIKEFENNVKSFFKSKIAQNKKLYAVSIAKVREPWGSQYRHSPAFKWPKPCLFTE